MARWLREWDENPMRKKSCSSNSSILHKYTAVFVAPIVVPFMSRCGTSRFNCNSTQQHFLSSFIFFIVITCWPFLRGDLLWVRRESFEICCYCSYMHKLQQSRRSKFAICWQFFYFTLFLLLSEYIFQIINQISLYIVNREFK